MMSKVLHQQEVCIARWWHTQSDTRIVIGELCWLPFCVEGWICNRKICLQMRKHIFVVCIPKFNFAGKTTNGKIHFAKSKCRLITFLSADGKLGRIHFMTA